jgi:hypothetical protein
MKTSRIYLCVAVFALTSICSGQLFSQNNNDVLFYTSYYNLASNRLEHQINQVPIREAAGDHYNTPVTGRTYFVPIEYDLAVEPWMTSSFESSFYEEDIQLEAWMETPFEYGYYEAALEVEDWMTEPFNSEDEIEIEGWMTAPWN